MNQFGRLGAIVALTCAAFSIEVNADVVFSDVLVRQRKPWSRVVDVYYTLSGAENPRAVHASFTSEGKALSIPEASLSGDRFNVGNGRHRLTWDPLKTSYATSGELTNVKVALTASDNPLYLIVDLEKSAGSEGQLDYVYLDDLHAGKWGSVVTNPVSGIASYVWAGVDQIKYKQKKIAFRRIEPGTVHDNEGNVDVTIDKPYYASVFELTDGQYKTVMGSYTLGWGDEQPAIKLSYDGMRGSETQNIDYPASGDAVADGSVVKAFRDRTGLAIDLPTKDMWYYAARAGSSGTYTDNVTADYASAPLKLLANYNSDGNAWGDRVVVGTLLPNAWGLYDVEGNVAEWALEKCGDKRYRLGGNRQTTEQRSSLTQTSTILTQNAAAANDGGSYNGVRLFIFEN